MAYTQADIDALADMAWREARGEGFDGMRAVAHVAVNRQSSPGTRWQGKNLPSIVNSKEFAGGAVNRATRSWQQARAAAVAVLGGRDPDPTNGATYFANPGKSEPHALRQITRSASPVAQIGAHVFYGTPSVASAAPDLPGMVPPPSNIGMGSGSGFGREDIARAMDQGYDQSAAAPAPKSKYVGYGDVSVPADTAVPPSGGWTVVPGQQWQPETDLSQLYPWAGDMPPAPDNGPTGGFGVNLAGAILRAPRDAYNWAFNPGGSPSATASPGPDPLKIQVPDMPIWGPRPGDTQIASLPPDGGGIPQPPSPSPMPPAPMGYPSARLGASPNDLQSLAALNQGYPGGPGNVMNMGEGAPAHKVYSDSLVSSPKSVPTYAVAGNPAETDPGYNPTPYALPPTSFGPGLSFGSGLGMPFQQDGAKLPAAGDVAATDAPADEAYTSEPPAPFVPPIAPPISTPKKQGTLSHILDAFKMASSGDGGHRGGAGPGGAMISPQTYGGSPGGYAFAGLTPWGSATYNAPYGQTGYSNSPYTPSGYTAPSFSSISGGPTYSYKPNLGSDGKPNGTGTFIDSHGNEHPY